MGNRRRRAGAAAMTAPPETLTVPEAATRLGLSVQRTRDLIRAGRLPASRHGQVYILDAASVAAFAAIPRAPGRPRSPRDPLPLAPRARGRPRK